MRVSLKTIVYLRGSLWFVLNFFNRLTYGCLSTLSPIIFETFRYKSWFCVKLNEKVESYYEHR